MRKGEQTRTLILNEAVALASQVGIGSALALTSAFFLAGAVLILFLPDTSKQELGEAHGVPSVGFADQQ